jgi:YggT family protein
MFIFGHLFKTAASLLHILLQLAILLFIVRALLSWFQPDMRHPVIAFIHQITDPVLKFIRRYIPPLGTVDLSPLIAILACWFLDSWLVGSLADLGNYLLR